MQPSSAKPDRCPEIPGIAQLVEGNGGLPKVRVTAPEAAGEIYLHGANVTSWKPRGGEEVIFVSAQSKWDGEHAIRGGVPICFPWFGAKADDPKAPQHGFVRAKAWRLETMTQTGGAVTVSMSTESDSTTKTRWAADFRLVLSATFGAELALELLMTNTGDTRLRFEEALHTYYRVGDVTGARVQGLDAVDYLDKTDAARKKTQHGEIVISAETDRVYLNTTAAAVIDDPAMRRRIRIAKENSRATVVWNPWAQKAHALSDFGDDEWKQMVCVETCNVADSAVELAPGEHHRMRAAISVAGL